MKTPIEMMLDGVLWREADGPPEDDDGTPWATHEGVMESWDTSCAVTD